MTKPHFRTLLFISMTAWVAAGIAGCGGSKLSGKYASDGNALTIEFKSGQATLSDTLGNTETVDYSVSGSTVTIKSKQREIKNHWINSSDGWITARISGSPTAPDHFIRELREITVADVQPDQVSDSDKLNGVDWSGSVTFKQTSCREAGDPGMALDGLSTPAVNRQRGQWSQWVDWQPEPVRLQRTKGQWQINPDTWLLRGTLPAAQDFANAGVK